MTAEQILELIQKSAPNKVPTNELTPFEYGVLAGQQQQIDRLEQYIKRMEDKNGNTNYTTTK
jgi:malonyl CoA-acyl carrier protein transacylase